MSAPHRILIVRLGAMGDILHALPAATSLKKSFPASELIWVTHRRWMPLLLGNPYLSEVMAFDRTNMGHLWKSAQALRGIRPALAFDFQGLVQSAAVGWLARPQRYWGFAPPMVRERPAAWFYTDSALPEGRHRIERNVGLTRLAGAQVSSDVAWIPPGALEGHLPDSPFVLASPFAGWGAKQWPLAYYVELGRLLSSKGLRLVLNVSPSQAAELTDVKQVIVHTSSLDGLVYATRRATAVVGVDSGPMHLAAALKKPGVGIYGPTDPVSHGPFGGSISVLRSATAATTYERLNEIQESMKLIKPEAVLQALAGNLAKAERLV